MPPVLQWSFGENDDNLPEGTDQIQAFTIVMTSRPDRENNEQVDPVVWTAHNLPADARELDLSEGNSPPEGSDIGTYPQEACPESDVRLTFYLFALDEADLTLDQQTDPLLFLRQHAISTTVLLADFSSF